MDLFAPRHLLIILLIVLLVFGTKKLKTIGADLGSAVKGFKSAMNEHHAESEVTAVTPPVVTLDKPAADATAPSTPKSTG